MEQVKRLNQLYVEIDSVFHETALRLGLTDSAMHVLYTLCNEGDACLLSDIVRISGISKQTINSALRKLEEQDMIRLELMNRRKKRVCLTEKGKSFVMPTIVRMLEIENEIYDSWTQEEREIYIRLTRRYLEQIKEKFKEIL